MNIKKKMALPTTHRLERLNGRVIDNASVNIGRTEFKATLRGGGKIVVRTKTRKDDPRVFSLEVSYV